MAARHSRAGADPQRIVTDQAGWEAAVTGPEFAEEFDLEGDSLKRPPKGFDPEHPRIEDLKRKDQWPPASSTRRRSPTGVHRRLRRRLPHGLALQGVPDTSRGPAVLRGGQHRYEPADDRVAARAGRTACVIDVE